MSSFFSMQTLLRKSCLPITTKDWCNNVNSCCISHPSLFVNNILNIYNSTNTYQRLGGIRGAKKKAGGSSTNGRNSAGRRLGIKVWPNQFARAGNIIVRQRGNLFRAGTNVGVGKDHTLFATASGIVSLTRLESNYKRNVVHVLPPSTTMHFNRLRNLGIDPVTLEAKVGP